MRLPDFIAAHSEDIMKEWVLFARTRLPAAAAMNEVALRDDGAIILREVVADMASSQTRAEQRQKSEGLRGTDVSVNSTPHRHATQRALYGFETLQLVSEYRALRATVLRLWSQSDRVADLHDLTDVTRFNEAIDEALADSLQIFVTEADHQRHLFMGVLGHDLRGPLHTIMSCAQLTLRKRPDDAREAAMILRSAAQLKALAEDLLEFTMHGLKLDVPAITADMQLETFCRQTLDEIATISPDRKVLFSFEGNPAGAWDARRLHQLLWNLVVNALKYGISERPVSVTVDGTQAAVVNVTVHNFGKPIAPEVIPNLLAPLVRGSAEQVTSPLPAGANIGLGLYIANAVAKAHGGHISIESTTELGTSFVVTLPRSPENRVRSH